MWEYNLLWIGVMKEVYQRLGKVLVVIEWLERKVKSSILLEQLIECLIVLLIKIIAKHRVPMVFIDN